MGKRASLIGVSVLLAFLPFLALARSDDDKLVRDRAKTLAKDRDPKNRASAAKSLGGSDT